MSIVCHRDASFKFESIGTLWIEGFRFLGCGSSKVKSVTDFLLEKTTFIGKNGSRTALEVDKTKVSIVDSLFEYNTVGSLRGPVRILKGSKYQYAYVGGAIIANQSNITIIKSRFMRNQADIGGAIFSTQSSNITIINSSFVGNSAVNYSKGLYFGGVLYADGGMTGVHNTPTQTSIIVSESEFCNNTATNGVVLTAVNCMISITVSNLHGNVADKCGGVL